MREAREAAGLSQGQVARKLDLHRPTISEIEAGRRRISADELQKFAELYDVSVDWIVNGSADDPTEDAKFLLAARELSKMRPQDFERLMKTIRMLRKPKAQ
jgi:transcriptional regulator with XRE-family HTH domain